MSDHILHDTDGDPIFIYSDLDYIPTGYSSTTAPFIESPNAVMRAAVDLFKFDTTQNIKLLDLGCGDGTALITMIQYIQQCYASCTVYGIGIDYSELLIQQAKHNTEQANLQHCTKYIIYDFNTNPDTILQQLLTMNICHIYMYLVPKQLALHTVKQLLLTLIEHGVMIICYHFQPTYLYLIRSNDTMNLCLYGKR